MSASEKLKALDATMYGEWKQISPGEPLIEGPFRNVQALVALRNALPQIVAVIAVAERVATTDDTLWGHSDAVGFVLEDALSELDRALS